MFAKIKEDTTQLQDLQGLLKGLNGNILKHDVKPLTEFGENYGSEIVSVDITVEEQGRDKVVHAVAKLIPPTEFQLQVFNTQVTFKNEIGFYAETVPALQEFQRENGISSPLEYAPRLLGARISLSPASGVVDNDGAIVMENLKAVGYSNFDRQTGFDLDSAKAILRVLANFQATTLAVRKKKPDVFKSKIQAYLHEWKSPGFAVDLDFILKENPRTTSLAPRVQKVVSKKRFKKIREPWATITHNDLWVNNIMIKESNSGAIDSIRFVDFQITDYASPAIDVLFFLFTSVQNSVLHFHLDKLLQFYYKEFVQVLQSFKVDTAEFTYESFQRELDQEAAYQIHHSLFMIFPILAPKGVPKVPGKVPEWNPDRKVAHTGPPSNGVPKEANVPKEPPMHYTLPMKEKIWLLVEEAAKRNWI